VDIQDLGDSYLCRHCNHEGLKSTFGMSICCPVCGSSDIVCAEFWKRFKRICGDGDGRGKEVNALNTEGERNRNVEKNREEWDE
jgi:hypothetical protein